MNSTPSASLTVKVVALPGDGWPTSALALPCASVVIFAIGVHPLTAPVHAAVVNVWFGVVPVKLMCAVGQLKVTLPLPGAWPVTVPMPPVTVPAGSSRELKALASMARASTAKPPEKASVTWKAPANVPDCGKVKFTVPAPCVSLVNEARFRQFEGGIVSGNRQNCNCIAVLPSGEPVSTSVPAPLLVVVSKVKVPT